MQMLAWLHKTPKDSSVTNGERFQIDLPHVDDDYLHLLDIIEELGLAGNNGMGVHALSFAEIRAWSEITDTTITPNEARALRLMSSAYAGQINSKDESCPIDDDRIRESIDMVNIKAMIGMAVQG